MFILSGTQKCAKYGGDIYGIISLKLGPGDNIQKSKTLIETTPTVFSGLIKEGFVKKKFLYL